MKTNQLKAGAVLSYISMGLGYVISIIYTPMMLRLLGQSEYGLYNLVSSVVSYLGLLSFGFGSAYVRYYSRYKVRDDEENIAKLNGMFLIVFTVIGFIAVLAGIILTLNTEKIFGSQLTSIELSKAKILMLILVINIAISFPSIIFNSFITANEEFVFQKVLQMIKIVINPFLVLPVLLMGFGSVGMVMSTTILNTMIEVINASYCLKKLKITFSFTNFDSKLMKEMTTFSSFIFINMIVDQINWNLDKYILGIFYGTAEVAIYSVGAQFNSYLMSISTVVSGVFTPRLHRMVASKSQDQEISNLFIRVGRIQYIIVAIVVLGFFVFGQSFIKLWAGEIYARSYYVAIILMTSVVRPLIQNLGIEIQRAHNKHRFIALTSIIAALMNLIISIPLTKLMGATGSAIGTFISVSLNGLVVNLYYQKVIGIDIKQFWRNIINLSKGLLIPLILAVLLKQFKNSFTDLVFLILSIPYTIIYIVSMYSLGLNNYEKQLLFKRRKCKNLH